MGHSHNEEKQKRKVKGDTHPIIDSVIGYKENHRWKFWDSSLSFWVIIVDKNLWNSTNSICLDWFNKMGTWASVQGRYVLGLI